MNMEKLYEWESVLEEYCLRPDLSKREFCQERNIDYPRFCRVIRLLELDDDQNKRKTSDLSGLVFCRVVVQQKEESYDDSRT